MTQSDLSQQELDALKFRDLALEIELDYPERKVNSQRFNQLEELVKSFENEYINYAAEACLKYIRSCNALFSYMRSTDGMNVGYELKIMHNLDKIAHYADEVVSLNLDKYGSVLS